MNLRFKTLKEISNRKTHSPLAKKREEISQFASHTFNLAVMEKMLSENIFDHLKECIQGRIKLKSQYIESIALAMKEWAISLNATHFCHWFQPMTGHLAEKQDSFIHWDKSGQLIEAFAAEQLLRGEPDASSFPSGGLRSTSQARGYTSWDPTSFPFLWEGGGSRILCIPAVFFSWTGVALDMKIPLLRSDAKLTQAALRLLNVLEIDAQSGFSTLGCEQEYFLIDRSLYLQRPDLLIAGRTLCGAPSPKAQELEDHYFGAIQERVLSFLSDLERESFLLGIPLKTRHKEVAPHQFEVAPIFEKSVMAVDHNILLMELMRQIAERHHLACLFHEKPFSRINGSGKHCNWSLSSDTGINFLSPGANKQENLLFLITMTAILHAVHRHSALLRASIGSAGNDHRLGGHEAPPAIISVFLGEHLEKWLHHFELDLTHQTQEDQMLDLRIPVIPDLSLDEADRNRTSPFAFTGNKFEFRAVGSSQHCAVPITVINAIVAESLNLIIDELEKGLLKNQSLQNVAPEVIRKYLKIAKSVRFCGDNYSPSWHKEAKRRKLPHIEKSLYAFDAFVNEASIKAFDGVLSKSELQARVDIMTERYLKVMNIESNLLADMFYTQILPVCFEYQGRVAKSIARAKEIGAPVGSSQMTHLKKCVAQINTSIEHVNLMRKEQDKVRTYTAHKRAKAFCDAIGPKTETARVAIDELETLIDDRLWPFPKYREILNIL